MRCAGAIRDGVRRLGVDVRAGVHTGEVEIAGEKPSGIAVHIAARIVALAQPGEIVVSSTVKDLAAGAAIRFRPCGTHMLKGIPGDWSLFAVD